MILILDGLSVFLKQLLPADAIAVRGGYFGTGIGRIHISSVRCLRNETTLMDCPHIPDPPLAFCDHSLDAGVICQGDW